jgi:copper chaperone CopZ
MEHLVVNIGGLHCQGCVQKVEALLQALPGVSRAEASLEEGWAKIDYDPQTVRPERFQGAIEAAGFDVSLMTRSGQRESTAKPRKPSARC